MCSKKPGVSLVDAIAGEPDQARTLWWSHEGNRALRDGDWKISSVKDGPWELYNLRIDRAETSDLATQEPRRTKMLESKWSELNDRHTEIAKNHLPKHGAPQE